MAADVGAADVAVSSPACTEAEPHAASRESASAAAPHRAFMSGNVPVLRVAADINEGDGRTRAHGCSLIVSLGSIDSSWVRNLAKQSVRASWRTTHSLSAESGSDEPIGMRLIHVSGRVEM